MLSDSGIVLARACRPRSFVGLMTLYESNYVRLRWLLPELEELESERISVVADDLPLHVNLVQRSRYTTTLNLTYFFDEAGQKVADPDLYVRIYHDAKLAEAMACKDQHRHSLLRSYETDHGSELQRRWSRNMMLNKWLEFCSEKDHRFVPLYK